MILTKSQIILKIMASKTIEEFQQWLNIYNASVGAN